MSAARVGARSVHGGGSAMVPEVPSTTSSLQSSAFSISRVAFNGNGGVISSVIWLTLSAGLCFPWLVAKPSSGKAGDEAKSVAWFVMLALDLIIGTISVFSLWFRRSSLSVMLLLWGSCAIFATYLLGSFAMLPAVATMCCCAPEICLVGAADVSVLDDNFCLINVNLCMETKWSMWCYYGGILLAMVSIVLLVNGVGLHHKALLACELQKKMAMKAAREARRARRRRQELWEHEVYGPTNLSSKTVHVGTSPKRYLEGEDEDATPPRQRGSLVPPSASAAARTPTVSSVARASIKAEGERLDLRLPTSMSRNNNDGKFSIGAFTGLRDDRNKNDLAIDEAGNRVEPLRERTSSNGGDVVMSWVADEEHGEGSITPKTALRFKTSAIARAFHN